MRTTASRLSASARELTAERGLAGFTVEELCDRVGVSRRTFFNYFDSKDDAVFGLESRRDESSIDERFLAAGAPSAADGGVECADTFGRLLDDLVILAVERWGLLDFTHEMVPTITAVFDREPRLALRLLELSAERDQVETELVERREGLPPGDLRAAAAVQIVGALSRAAVQEFLDPHNFDDFAVIIRRRLAAASWLFAAQSSGSSTSTPAANRTITMGRTR